MPEKKYHILYVDDEVNNLVSFKACFRQHYQIHTAQNLKEVSKVMEQHEIVLIICDQRMPELTGSELLEQLVERYPDTIRMILTAYSDVDSMIQAINRGKIYQFINKPWNAEELKIIIDHALETYSLRIENKNLAAERIRLQMLYERQQKENILSQLETLKNQVNPHFLFNCLNTLSYLVHEDPHGAEEFILKLTLVYRYVLEQKDKVVVTVEEELRFMRSFFYLQKIRFGDNIHLTESNIAAAWLGYYVPPLALQLLLENCIKHNIVSRDLPLFIELFIDEEGHLIVKNNFQKKEVGNSTGIGLQNLKERYSFISKKKPEFYIADKSFHAKIPLLKHAPEHRIQIQDQLPFSSANV